MEKKKVTNDDARYAVKVGCMSVLEKMTEMARKIDEKEYELLRAKEVREAERQANNAANHIMRACQYDIAKADLAYRMDKLVLEKEKFYKNNAKDALAGL